MRLPLLLTLLCALGCSPVMEVRRELYPHSGKVRYQGTVERRGDVCLAEREWIFWYPNGRLQARGCFRDGGLVANTDVEATGTRVPLNGRHGRWTFWSPEGQILSAGNYSHGAREGPWMCWHENGQPCSLGSFATGLEEGHHVRWHENGVKSEVRRYVHGVPNGPAQRWDERGTLVWSGEFVDGVPSSPVKGLARSSMQARSDLWGVCLRRDVGLGALLAAE